MIEKALCVTRLVATSSVATCLGASNTVSTRSARIAHSLSVGVDTDALPVPNGRGCGAQRRAPPLGLSKRPYLHAPYEKVVDSVDIMYANRGSN